MSFNVWLGGDVVDFGGVVRAIRAADADVVGLQEAEGNTARIAKALGWPYWSDRLHVVSRYPLIDPPDARGAYVLAQVKPGQVFALANEHLTSDPYGPYLVRDGKSLAQVLRNERVTRMPEVRALLRGVGPALRRRHPDADDRRLQHAVAPRLDAGTAGTPRGPTSRIPVAWPVTPRVRRGRASRTPTASPIPTRSRTRASRGRSAIRSRDCAATRSSTGSTYVQASRGVQVLDSGIAGPSGTPDVTVPIDPCPSDHRGVDRHGAADARRAAALRLGDRPPRRARRADPRPLRRAARGSRGAPAVVRHGDAADAALMTLPPQEAGYYGAVRFGSGALAPGRYDALLVDARRRRPLAQRPSGSCGRARGRRCACARPSARRSRSASPGATRPPTARLGRDLEGGRRRPLQGYYGFAYTGARVAGHDAARRPPPARAVRRATAARRRLRRAGAGVVHGRAAPLSAAPMLHRW